MVAKALREGQEGVAVANEERDVGEEEDINQHAAVGKQARAEATIEITRWSYLVIYLSQNTWQLKY